MLIIDFSHLVDLPDSLLSADVSHGIVKAGDSNSEAVKSLISPIDGDHGSPGVGLGHSPVPLQDDNLGPDLVIDALPLVPNLLDVVLTMIRVRLDVTDLVMNIRRISSCRNVGLLNTSSE